LIRTVNVTVSDLSSFYIISFIHHGQLSYASFSCTRNGNNKT